MAPETQLQAETPAPEAQAAPVTPEPTPAADLFKIKYNGQEIELTRDKVIELAQQGQDYTQKAQTVAQQRRLVEQLGQVLNTERSRVAGMLQDRAALRAHLESLGPDPSEQSQIDPNEGLTVEQGKQMLAQEIAQAKQTILQEVQEATFKAETTRLEQGYRNEVDSTVKKLMTDMPQLTEWLDADAVDTTIRRAAAKFVADSIQANPYEAVSIDAVKNAMTQAATAQLQRIEKKIEDQKKMQAVRDAKLTKQGIEAPGGAAPVTQEPQKFKLGDRNLTQSVIAELNAAFSKA